MNNEERIIELLEELVKWTRVTSIPEAKTLLEETLASSKERIAYHVSDGRKSKEVAKLANASYSTIIKWWKKWIKVGIAESMPAKGGERAKALFSLEDFGIEIPSPENSN